MRPIGTNDDVLGETVVEDTANSASSRVQESRTRSQQSARFEDIVGVRPRHSRDGGPKASLDGEVIERLIAASAHDRSLEDAFQQTAALLNAHAGFDFVAQMVATEKESQLQPLAGSVELLSQEIIREIVTAATGSGTDSRVFTATLDSGSATLIGFAANPSTANRSLLEMAAARLSVRILRSTLQQSTAEVQHTAAIIELIAGVSGAKDLTAATERIANELRSYLNAGRVYIGVCPVEQQVCRLSAVSDVEFDSQSESTQRVEAVLQESIARSTASQWPAVDANNRHALLAHQQFVERTEASGVVASPLFNEQGQPVGAILVEFDESLEESSAATLRILSAAAGPLASSLNAIRTSSQSFIERMRSGVRRAVGRRKMAVVAAGVAALSAVMLIPVDYRVTCEAELQPVLRRFVAAPFDAPLKECLVEPGDVVQEGQLLAELDGRELRWELAGIRADLGKATKEHNAFLSERKSGEAAIARHEIERLQNREAVLLDRTKNLEIRSPQAGIVVAGDLKDTEGVPLETGESLFEIAPLDRMSIEVAIPEDDIRHVDSGMIVRLVLDSAPADVVEAKIERLHPRAEVREEDNVFVAEAVIENEDSRFRPGMKGEAKVSTGAQTLGWTLLHKPFAHVIGWLGW